MKHLEGSIAFRTSLGFTFDPKFTDENASCMIVGDNIFVMLLVESFFKTFSRKALCDATKETVRIGKLKLPGHRSCAR